MKIAVHQLVRSTNRQSTSTYTTTRTSIYSATTISLLFRITSIFTSDFAILKTVVWKNLLVYLLVVKGKLEQENFHFKYLLVKLPDS